MTHNHYHRWVLLTLILAALPSLLTLPVWVSGIALAGGIFHYLASLRKGWGGKAASALLLSATAAGIWFSFESWFSGKAVLTFFIAVVFLKWGESHTRRDYLLLTFASVILASVGALYWENLWSLLHMLLVIFSLTLSLVAIHGDVSFLTRKFLLRCAGQLFLLGLPLMLLLFMTFPRVPGPLWDIGLAFGLPVKALMDAGGSDFGKETTLQLGASGASEQDNNTVLIAEFKGAVPFKSRLYWRGPVYWDFDGVNWTLPDTWDNRSALMKKSIRSKKRLDHELRHRGTPVRYNLRVMANGGRWLFGLDVPAAPAPEVFISDEFQLLAVRKVNTHQAKFPMLSYLDYGFGAKLTDEARARALAWPEESNPRLWALGQELAADYTNSQALVHQVLNQLLEADITFDISHIIPVGEDMLDRYFFDEKKGGSECLAGSTAMLLRAAGVPARLVSGYRGGTLIALTNFVLVKRSDAHTWVEVWHDDTGWVRVEGKDIILPPEKKPGEKKKDDPDANTSRVKVKKNDDQPFPDLKKTPEGKEKASTAPTGVSDKKRWELPGFTSLFGGLQKWVINYNPDRQADLLEGMGVEESNWLDLLISGVLGILALLGSYLGIAWWRSHTAVDPVAKAWKKFCIQLAKLGVEKGAYECPRAYLERALVEHPEMADVLGDVIGRYIDIRYGGDNSAEAATTFKRQVERFVAMT